ncbi:AAA family ATPase [Bradyrhizobium sp. DASA03076]|uniref:AAA family ATPase n=1 Tax=Bradyrhizobium sp. BLXBL-03 TaxID=3395916 RepID=UPI003F6EFB57
MLDYNDARPQEEPPRRKSGRVRGCDSFKISVADIKERLHEDVRGFVQWLYSGRAFLHRHEARIGNIYGEPGSSLVIELGGRNVGQWYDHATDQGGDIISLYRGFMGYQGVQDFDRSIREIAADYFHDIELDQPAWTAARRITPSEKIAANKKQWGDKPKDEAEILGPPVATYRYLDVNGNVIAAVTRYEPKTFRPWCFREIDGEQKWMIGSPPVRPIYHLPEVSKSDIVVLVEGEGKADALATFGVVTTSLMGGANAVTKTDWTPLKGKKVVVWPDNDAAGRKFCTDATATLLSIGCKVLVVQIPAGKPEKWDCANCISDGEDPLALLITAIEVAGNTDADGLDDSAKGTNGSNADASGGAAGAGNTSQSDQQSGKQQRRRFERLNVRQIKAKPDPVWLVENLINENSLGFIYGPPGSLKTFIALDMALSFASGQAQWWGRAIARKGAAIYLCREGSSSLKFRIMAWEKHRKAAAGDAPFYLIEAPVNFMSWDDIDALAATVEDVATEINGPISSIFVDTVSRALPGAEENLQRDVSLFVGACEALQKAFGCIVVGIHHTNASGGFRGSTVMPAAGDFIIEVRREAGVMTGSIFAAKIKDAEDGWEQNFKVSKIELDDDKVSLVVDPVHDKAKREGKTSWPSRAVCQEILAAIHEQWVKKNPWCYAGNTSRAAVPIIMTRWGLKRAVVKDILSSWTANGIIEEVVYDTKNKQRGYRKLVDI